MFSRPIILLCLSTSNKKLPNLAAALFLPYALIVPLFICLFSMFLTRELTHFIQNHSQCHTELVFTIWTFPSPQSFYYFSVVSQSTFSLSTYRAYPYVWFVLFFYISTLTTYSSFILMTSVFLHSFSMYYIDTHVVM